jgi:SSS family solute:Na+ symporter
MDVVRQFRPHLRDATVVRVGRVMTAALLVVAILWAPELQRFPSLWQYLQAALAYAVPPVVVVFVLGLFWRGAEASGAAAAMLVGSLAGLGLFVVNVLLGWTHIHFLYVAPMLAAFDALVLVAVSLSHSRAGGRPSAHAWSPAPAALLPPAEPRPLWQDYRLQAVVLLLLTAAIVIAFR